MDTSEQQLELQKGFYRRLCSESEIERIFAPKSALDYLLKMRADYIVDNMRIYRFYRRQWLKMGAAYTLEGTFSKKHYKRYLKTLNRADRDCLSQVTYGDIFVQEANGQIFNSPYGRIVTISHSLRYFLEFSCLAILRFDLEIPPRVRFAALIIALRVMFQYESMDFDADPRGKLPPKLLAEMRRPIPAQLDFIAGHEFAHQLLGHLSDEKLHSEPKSDHITGELPEPLAIYSTSEAEELNADLTAIVRPEIDDARRAQLLNAVIIWFGALELYQHARDVISPEPAWKPRSHPRARARHLHLVKNVETKYSATVSEISDSVIGAVENFKTPLTDYLSCHIDDFETYGSIYLDSPDTPWRGKELIDRVDYY